MNQKYNRFGLGLAAGLVGGVVPVGAYLALPADNPYCEWVTKMLATRLAHMNYKIWQRGDFRPKRIILVRHGQTHGYSHTCDCQVAGLPVCAMKPEIDRPLTEEGKLQALKAGVALKHVIGEEETCTFFVSPYKSCKQTFSYIGGSFPNLKSTQYVEEPRLRNQDYGNWHLREAPEKVEEYKRECENVGRFYFQPIGGESAATVYDRISSLLETLYRKFKHPTYAQNYIFITHSVVIQTFLCRWFHWDIDTFHRLEKFKNGQLAVMEKQEDGSYKLVTPLPCKPPKPEGVKILASGPSLK